MLYNPTETMFWKSIKYKWRFTAKSLVNRNSNRLAKSLTIHGWVLGNSVYLRLVDTPTCSLALSLSSGFSPSRCHGAVFFWLCTKRKKVKERVHSYKERKEGGREGEIGIVGDWEQKFWWKKWMNNAVMRLTWERKWQSERDREKETNYGVKRQKGKKKSHRNVREMQGCVKGQMIIHKHPDKHSLPTWRYQGFRLKD